MLTTDEAVLDFMAALAQVRSAFREQHIRLERLAAFDSVTTATSPFMARSTVDPSHALKGVTLNIAIDADVKSPTHPNRRALEASILVRRTSDGWVVDGEIGWSGRDMGSDVFDEIELTTASVSELSEQLPSFATELMRRYAMAVDDYLKGDGVE